MRFGLGYLGRTGTRKSLPAGQTLMHAAGAAVVTFIAPTYTAMSAVGAAVASFIGASGTPPTGGALKADFSSSSSEWFFF